MSEIVSAGDPNMNKIEVKKVEAVTPTVLPAELGPSLGAPRVDQNGLVTGFNVSNEVAQDLGMHAGMTSGMTNGGVERVMDQGIITNSNGDIRNAEAGIRIPGQEGNLVINGTGRTEVVNQPVEEPVGPSQNEVGLVEVATAPIIGSSENNIIEEPRDTTVGGNYNKYGEIVNSATPETSVVDNQDTQKEPLNIMTPQEYGDRVEGRNADSHEQPEDNDVLAEIAGIRQLKVGESYTREENERIVGGFRTVMDNPDMYGAAIRKRVRERARDAAARMGRGDGLMGDELKNFIDEQLYGPKSKDLEPMDIKGGFQELWDLQHRIVKFQNGPDNQGAMINGKIAYGQEATAKLRERRENLRRDMMDRMGRDNFIAQYGEWTQPRVQEETNLMAEYFDLKHVPEDYAKSKREVDRMHEVQDKLIRLYGEVGAQEYYHRYEAQRLENEAATQPEVKVVSVEPDVEPTAGLRESDFDISPEAGLNQSEPVITGGPFENNLFDNVREDGAEPIEVQPENRGDLNVDLTPNPVPERRGFRGLIDRLRNWVEGDRRNNREARQTVERTTNRITTGFRNAWEGLRNAVGGIFSPRVERVNREMENLASEGQIINTLASGRGYITPEMVNRFIDWTGDIDMRRMRMDPEIQKAVRDYEANRQAAIRMAQQEQDNMEDFSI